MSGTQRSEHPAFGDWPPGLAALKSPRRLHHGDRVAAVSLSWGGPSAFPERYRAGVQELEARYGLKVVPSEHAFAPASWLREHPQARAADLHAAFRDPHIAGIIATIGGDDAMAMLPFIDLELIAAHPKPFIGFSDSTTVHLMCLRAGLRSFYGPSIMAGFAENGGLHRLTQESFRRTICDAAPQGALPWHGDRTGPEGDRGWTNEFLDWSEPSHQRQRRQLQPPMAWRFLQSHHRVQGRLLGGCADTLESLRNTPLWPPPALWRGAVLFLELSEADEPPEVLEGWVRRYGEDGILSQLAALLFARPGATVPADRFEAYDEALLRAMDACGRADMPLVTRCDFGHTAPLWTLPYGALCTIDPQKGLLLIDEPAVSES